MGFTKQRPISERTHRKQAIRSDTKAPTKRKRVRQRECTLIVKGEALLEADARLAQRHGGAARTVHNHLRSADATRHASRKRRSTKMNAKMVTHTAPHQPFGLTDSRGSRRNKDTMAPQSRARLPNLNVARVEEHARVHRRQA